jgi:hypothetical protein
MVNVVGILCSHVCKWTNETCSNYSRKARRGIKDNDGWGEFNHDIL